MHLHPFQQQQERNETLCGNCFFPFASRAVPIHSVAVNTIFFVFCRLSSSKVPFPFVSNRQPLGIPMHALTARTDSIDSCRPLLFVLPVRPSSSGVNPKARKEGLTPGDLLSVPHKSSKDGPESGPSNSSHQVLWKLKLFKRINPFYGNWPSAAR